MFLLQKLAAHVRCLYTCFKEGLILTAGKDKMEVRGGCQGSWGTEMTNRKTALHSACCHQGQPEGGCQREPAGGHPGTCSSRHIKLASPCMEPFVQQNPAWPTTPPLPPSSSLLHSAHQQTPNKHTSRKQTPAQPACSPPPPSSQEAQRRHFTRTDDAAKTTIMIINLLNLEDYAVN